MEVVIIVAISILGCVFIASFIALVVLCRQMYYNRKWNLEQDDGVDGARLVIENDEAEMELGDVDIFNCDENTIQQLLETEDFAYDSQGILPQCISILKLCREVTEKLVALTMSMNPQNIHPIEMAEIVQIAQKIGPRVDEVMQALQPPLNTKLLEAHSASLILSVSHLALVVKKGCRMYHGSLDWIDQAVSTLDKHMKILRGLTTKEEKLREKEPCDTMSDKNCSSLDFEDGQSSRL